MTDTLAATSFSPTITANDLPGSLAFYTALGFEIESQHEQEGVVRFYMLKSGNCRVGIGMDDFAKGRDRKKGVGMRLWLHTAQNLNEFADRLKAAGVKLDSEPAALEWGPMAFSVTDPDGFAITIQNPE